MAESTLTQSEVRALDEFEIFMMKPNQMLCFSGPGLEKHNKALETLSDKNLLFREKPHGAYSLTEEGYSAMKQSAS